MAFRRIEIESGARFGRLVTTGASQATHGGIKWECACDCGTTKWVYGHSLRRRTTGNTRSCGCLHSEVASAKHRAKITGQRFGRLLVLEFAGITGEKASRWKCLCDCGKEIILLSASIASGTKSCGCLRAEINLPVGLAARNVVLSRYKKMARVRGVEYALSDERAISLFSQDCHYCGSGPTSKQGNGSFGRFNGEYAYNGIDRMDNSCGYVEGNVVPCCAYCNRAKNVMSYTDFLGWLRRVARFVNKGGVDAADFASKVG